MADRDIEQMVDRYAEPPPLPKDWCHWHNIAEPIPPGCYRVCGECGHAFATAEELLGAYNGDRPPGCPEEHDPERIYFCPLCIHDF